MNNLNVVEPNGSSVNFKTETCYYLDDKINIFNCLYKVTKVIRSGDSSSYRLEQITSTPDPVKCPYLEALEELQPVRVKMGVTAAEARACLREVVLNLKTRKDVKLKDLDSGIYFKNGARVYLKVNKLTLLQSKLDKEYGMDYMGNVCPLNEDRWVTICEGWDS